MHEPIKEKIIEKVSDIISKGNFILGEEVEKFEKDFAKYCGTKYCIGVASGSDALVLSLKSLGLTKKKIISVANTFVATVDSIIRNDSQLYFTEIDEKTLQINTNLIEDAIDSETKAIIPVDLFGNMPDWSHIKEISEKNNLLIVEDACQAHGSKFNSVKAGNFGDLSCFSFYPGKNLGAFGDGGAIVTNNEEHRDKLLKLRNYGQAKKHYHDTVGFNSRLDSIQACVLREKLKHLDSWIEQKRKSAEIYQEQLKSLEDFEIPRIDSKVFHSYHLFPVIVKKRDELQNFLMKNEISTGIHYPIPIHKQEGYQNLCFHKDLEITENIAKSIISLPMYPGISVEQIVYVSDMIRKFYNS